MELKEYLSVIVKRWWVLALTVLLCFAAAIAYNTKYQPMYRASVDLIVNEPSLTSTGQAQVDSNSIEANLKLINTYKKIINSDAITKIVAERHPELNLTSSQISNKLMIDSTQNTQVINVAVLDASYEKAATLANSTGNVFIDQIPEIMQLNNVAVLNAADSSLNPEPVNDHRQMVLALALIIGLLLGFGIIFLIEYLDDSVKTELDVEHAIGVPVLARIDRIAKSDLRNQHANDAGQEEPAVLRPANEQR
ncbi:Wzz/FepE/Etk N-terminal domain-containing protein [Saccharibacillus sp. CPCC 101409]|uniref:YveK family protein n=1 Tax=Saccharibacillus sp. CPCC 101409 TaxID=3058041 RepID=UPI002671F32D|nr:Wzz/FepE/Etk N-terminal domain-containing protein [Saccharibacillus sp. CPCC 101409]MDO3411669.1 Wzz/FepE/Etk N-terminal domain-containing protein [Saccharibacillus sp. CPCC 101409]